MPWRDMYFEFETGEWKGHVVRFRARRVVVKVIPPDDTETSIVKVFDEVLHHFAGCEIIERIGKWAVIRLPDGTEVLDAVKALEQWREVEYAEPDLAMRMAAFDCQTAPLRVNDEYVIGKEEGGLWREQWGIRQIGMPEAWCHETGKDHVLIGLVDTGIPILESDSCPGALAPGDFLGECCGHDDLDGTRIIVGRDYVDEDDPASLPNDLTGHGTSVAGILAARENNVRGIAGLNWVSNVYACGVVDSNAKTSHADVYRAVVEIIEFAGATASVTNLVINLSQYYENAEDGTAIPDLGVGTLDELCEKIVDAGAIVCCAAGNSSEAIDTPASKAETYPDNIVAVGATSLASPKGETVWDNSNYGRQLTVVAPGDDVQTLDKGNRYHDGTGTSFATPHVTALASLLWSHDAGLTAAEVVDLVKKTAWMPEDTRWPPWVENEGLPVDLQGLSEAEALKRFWGSGRIDAHKALAIMDAEVTLLTPNVAIEDVPDGLTQSAAIEFEVISCVELTFSVAAAGDNFGIDTAKTFRHAPENGELFEQIVASYTASSGQPSAAGTATVTWLETGQTWTIDLSASRAATASTVVLLTADASGSMSQPSGIGTYTRMEVLDYSSGILVDEIEEGSSMGVVGFKEAAFDVADVTLIDPQHPEVDRDALKTEIDTLGAGGYTSIGAGIIEAKNKLDAEPAEPAKAILVLTDGKENRDPTVAEAMSDMPYPVYAIAMGTAAVVQPDSLMTMTSNTGGYLLITGELDDDSEFVIAKYYDQIVADITGVELAADPMHRLRAGSRHEIEFKLTRADMRADVNVMMPYRELFDVAIEPPRDGRLKGGLNEISVCHGDRLSRFRFSLPARLSSGSAAHAGTWRAILTVNEKRYKKFLSVLKETGQNVENVVLHGVHYAVTVHTLSNLRLRTRLTQEGFTPGSRLFLRAELTHNGLPLTGDATVEARLVAPEGSEEKIVLKGVARGVFETTVETRSAGVYKLQMVARGTAPTGEAFRRERIVTGAVWHTGVSIVPIGRFPVP